MRVILSFQASGRITHAGAKGRKEDKKGQLEQKKWGKWGNFNWFEAHMKCSVGHAGLQHPQFIPKLRRGCTSDALNTSLLHFGMNRF